MLTFYSIYPVNTHHKLTPRTDCTGKKNTAISNDIMVCLIAVRKKQDVVLLT